MKLFQIVFVLVALYCSVQFCTAIPRRIGAFNIRVFGRSKAEKPTVMADLVQILKRYDLVLLQEIRDITGTAIDVLLDQLNHSSAPADQYAKVIGRREGSTSSKEQYCYFYKISIFTVLGSYEYPESYNYFERPPYNVLFRDKIDNKTFVASGLHAKPDHAVKELDKMTKVYDFIQITSGPSNVVMMGDFNAGCAYVRRDDWSRISLWTSKAFKWLIDNNADTTVTKGTNCPYDRIVYRSVTTGSLKFYNGSVFKFDERLTLHTSNPLDISDHYPVEAYVDMLDKSSTTSGLEMLRTTTSFCVTSLYLISAVLCQLS